MSNASMLKLQLQVSLAPCTFPLQLATAGYLRARSHCQMKAKLCLEISPKQCFPGADFLHLLSCYQICLCLLLNAPVLQFLIAELAI